VNKWEIAFSSEIAGRLARLAADEGATSDAVFVGAMLALLARYAGKDEVSLAVEAHGRTDVVRATLDGDPDAPALVRRAKSAMSRATPLAAPRPKHRVAGVPDADVLLVLEAPDASVTADVTVAVKAASLELRFRASRFDHAASARISEHLRALLTGMAAASGALSATPIVVGEERAWILDASNVAAVRLDEELPSVVECFERHARSNPAAAAVVDEGRELTYRQLDDAANVLCDRLRARGLDAGQRIAVYLERGADAVIAFLAILKARGTYVPIDTGYPTGRVEAILASARPRLVVTRSGLASALPAPAGDERRGAPAFSRGIRRTRSSRRARRVSPRASSSGTARSPTTCGRRSMRTASGPKTGCSRPRRSASI
jgi:non-ribosomal peptide synthetase component F